MTAHSIVMTVMIVKVVVVVLSIMLMNKMKNEEGEKGKLLEGIIWDTPNLLCAMSKGSCRNYELLIYVQRVCKWKTLNDMS